MESIIKTENLSKSFKRGSNTLFAVKNVNFTLEEGDFVNIIGRSGSGKSTFLNLLSGLLKPTEGKIFAKGKDMSDFSDREISKYRNEVIGFVPQSLGTLPNLNVLENVSLPYYLFKRDDSAYEKAAMLLDEMGILHLKDDFPKNLSGGELKRVLIARSMINSPELLILDEPTSDLDKNTTMEIMDLLKKINSKGTALIIVTHELDILKYGNTLCQMEDGSLIKKEG
ncbi:MAG: ABC transporter ATP-binding protein [Peptoniphilus harei]|uniref:ABC transporter, ATP-binding protein n=6 Tax=Peptoniphilus TaxID=162289 RepID=E4KWH2_9FIRM|nr:MULTISPECIES: ABC transporter ATP-binding protein [Peptoniphilus]EFR33810.1 ABC transporter, ATP-binding protein [Peptoniphilus harei ACS-146-V-Sch2b]KXA27772.1 ABC transporter, ATP-binding protein [Peptoniphilus harei]MBM7550006.1 putative ABC transport system ATP-binding protein [Peptoniphilus gorbachii]MBS5945295.1 ABC transporter ATP-binding protein [Peptoniphilus harei]MBS6535086.1 ABC transporter ATP-binding protein [Peptoniphilus harei]